VNVYLDSFKNYPSIIRAWWSKITRYTSREFHINYSGLSTWTWWVDIQES